MMALLVVLATGAISLAIPQIALVCCVLTLALQILLSVLRLSIGPTERRFTTRPAPPAPWFSIHVATHDEPPAVVIATLDALAGMDFSASRFEVIVLDNNTSDPTLWMPVKRHCARLGPLVRFFHETGVQGAKAGALNISLARTDARATHIVTVDADYRVATGFLTEAERALSRTGADYVQFPQAYQRPAHLARGVDIELEDYFRVEATMADGAEAVLLTGTLCVISKAALQAVGGWSGRTATEDAELGMRLCEAGFTGRFVARVVGKGLLPLAFQDLASQRARWSGGNLRTLVGHLPSMIGAQSPWGARKAAAVTAQLGAWLNFGLIPAACLLAARMGYGSATLALVAASSVLLAFLDILARLVDRGLHDRLTASAVFAAIASRIALAPTAAIATVHALLPGRQGFVVTAKDVTRGWRMPVAMLPHGVLFIAAALAALQPSMGLVADVATVALLLPLPAALMTGIELARYRRHLAELAHPVGDGRRLS